MDYLESFLSIAANMKSIIGIGGGVAVLSGLGALPRVGIGRAFVLGLKSSFNFRYTPISVRTDEIRSLKSKLKHLPRGRYVVVIGGKGVGKSCLIDTTLSRTLVL
jgi:hypothetical protein